MKKTLRAIALLTLLAPLSANATSHTGGSVSGGISNLGTLINTINVSILNNLVTLFATAALVAFFFGMVQFIWASREGDSKKIENGKNFMLWSVIALFVMFSIWGIVRYGQTIFGFSSTTIDIPRINFQGGTTNTTNTTALPTDTTNTTNTSNTVNNAGADCQTPAECSSGLSCIRYKCVDPNSCAGQTTFTACNAKTGCTWSDAELSCSQ